ncbi:unnamed protein product [Porites evermanni]|uniref:Uncharacterized protein n=1 Tax=Porites evermanni TaxID=104178 RepID=A0ABN8PNB6_9CNID|nr:unnamed protein product [Porites evermanni]
MLEAAETQIQERTRDDLQRHEARKTSQEVERSKNHEKGRQSGPLVKATIFLWTVEHDVAMRNPERGKIWKNIAAKLNSLQQPKFSVTASQELFTKQKLCDEEKASIIE